MTPKKPVGQAWWVVHGGSRALTLGDSTCSAGFVGVGCERYGTDDSSQGDTGSTRSLRYHGGDSEGGNTGGAEAHILGT